MKKEVISYKEAYDKINSLGGCDATDEWSKGYDEGITAALNALENIPRKELKSGYWKEEDSGYDPFFTCTECGLSLGKSDYTYEEWQEVFKNCPCCTAEMKGVIRNDV